MSKPTAGWPEKLPPKIAKRKTHEQTVQNASGPQQNDRSATNSLWKGNNAFSGCDAQKGVKCVTENSATTNCATKRPGGYVLDVFNALLSQEAEAAYRDAMSVCDDAGDAGIENDGTAAGAAHVGDGVNCGADPVNHPRHYCQGDHDVVNHPSHYCPGDHDAVNHPAHYTQGGVECIDAIQAAVTGLSGMEAVCAANAIKYIWRHKYKHGTEDLRKARFYLNKLILLSERKDKKESCGASERKERKGCS